MGLDQSTSMPNSGVLGFAQLKGYISKFNRKKKCDLVGEGKEKSRMNRERETKTSCTYVHYFLKNAKKKPLKLFNGKQRRSSLKMHGWIRNHFFTYIAEPTPPPCY